MTVEFSLDGVDFTSIASILDSSFNDFDPTPADATGWNRRLVLDLDDTLARYVRMTFANDMEWTFLGEVQFVQDAAKLGAIPEPGCVAMLATALGALGGYVRRRRHR